MANRAHRFMHSIELVKDAIHRDKAYEVVVRVLADVVRLPLRRERRVLVTEALVLAEGLSDLLGALPAGASDEVPDDPRAELGVGEGVGEAVDEGDCSARVPDELLHVVDVGDGGGGVEVLEGVAAGGFLGVVVRIGEDYGFDGLGNKGHKIGC